MCPVVATFEVPEKGIGKPDYTRIVAGARERRGIHLDYGQTLKVFGITFSAVPSPFPWVITPPLAPAATAHMIDTDTGLPSPYTVPQGYTMTVIAVGMASTEDGIVWVYIDGFVVLSGGIVTGGENYFENKLSGISTADFDPTGLLPHTMDGIITNLGLGNLEGSIDYVAILEKVGSPPLPPVKTVRCKWCGYEHEVPNETTRIICPKCGRLFIVMDHSKFRRSP
jgi:predicted RNA-binding Zn-ribbon protein involved in translation (DUF1610 family)